MAARSWYRRTLSRISRKGRKAHAKNISICLAEFRGRRPVKSIKLRSAYTVTAAVAGRACRSPHVPNNNNKRSREGGGRRTRRTKVPEETRPTRHTDAGPVTYARHFASNNEKHLGIMWLASEKNDDARGTYDMRRRRRARECVRTLVAAIVAYKLFMYAHHPRTHNQPHIIKRSSEPPLSPRPVHIHGIVDCSARTNQ